MFLIDKNKLYKMKTKILLFALLAFTIGVAKAQSPIHPKLCGITEHMERMKVLHGYNALNAAEEAAYEAEIQELILAAEGEQRGGGTVYIIPIVFHIAHEGGPENISEAQVINAIEIINKDFNKQNADTAVVVSAFQSIIANVGFEFRLAQKDALGNCVRGITRTYTALSTVGDNAMVSAINRNVNAEIGQPTNSNNIRFPRGKYLNIWVCKSISSGSSLGGVAGYTNTPNNWQNANYDGIWITHSYVGNIGTGSVTGSRALTHEIGHWINLRHTWGNTNDPGVSCGDDLVSDTPTTMGWTTCNLTGTTCSSLDNVQNFMEYSYCSKMFTVGQKNRMVAALNSSTGSRNTLWLPANLVAAGVADGSQPVLCQAEFNAPRRVICEGEAISFEDNSFHGPTSWSWTFTGAATPNSTDQNPTGIVYNTAGTYSVSLTVTSPNGTQSTSKTNYITVLPAQGLVGPPIIEGFEALTTLPTNEWYLDNADGANTWIIATGVGSSGTKCAKINSGATSGYDDFISTTYDLSALSSVVVNFKYAFAYKSSGNTDKLKFYVSNDCGASWSLRKTVSGSSLPTAPNTTGNFTPTASQWAQVDITNIAASYLTDNFRFKISFEAGGGNNIYIDDINISAPVSVNEIHNPYAFGIYPNPSNQNATISFTLAKNENVSIEITDMLGQVVRTVSKGELNNGAHNYNFSRDGLSNGVYFVKLKVGTETITKKLILN